MNRTYINTIILVIGLLPFKASLLASEIEFSTDSVRLLEELNVVAIKQQNILRNEAVASTVLGKSELENINASAVKNISDVIPNFYIPDYGSRATSTIYVRGIGARMDQPSVGMIVDNVPLLNKNTYDFDLTDIASVEMLRGPQSTLYGRNTIGGLINITTLSPFAFQGIKLMLHGATHRDFKASLGWYKILSEKTASSINASFTSSGGCFTNKFNGKKLDKEKFGSMRWKIEHVLSNRLKIINSANASILRQGGYPYMSIESGEINYNDTCFYHRFCFNDGLTVNYRFDNLYLSSVTSFQYLVDNITLDQDFLPLPYFTLTQKQHEYALTEDIVAKGISCEGRWHWVSGLFGFYKRTGMSAPVTFKDEGIASLIVSNRNNANPDYPIVWNTNEFDLLSRFTIPTSGVAIYHESNFISGNWTFGAGLRLDWERTVMSYNSFCDTGYVVNHIQPNGQISHFADVNILIDEKDKLSKDFINWLPKLSVLYNLPLSGENNVYVSLSKGYKSGGFNTQMFSDVLQQKLMGIMGIGSNYDVDEIVGYKPEYSWNYEIGTHLSYPGIKLNLDFNLFLIDCRNQQITMFPSGSTTGRIMSNAGRTRNSGLEIAFNWQPFNNFNIAASYGLTNAKFRKFNNGIEDYQGKYLPYAPKNTIFLNVDYTIGLGDNFVKRMCVDANLRAAGKIYWNEANTLSQDIYTLLGSGISIEGSGWSFKIFGNNLTNNRYYTFYFKSMGNEFLQQGKPIQIGASLRIEI